MDGGKLCVPNGFVVQFYKRYTECINAGECIPLVEKLGYRCTMRFFLDVDNPGENLKDIVDAGVHVTGVEATVFRCTDTDGAHIVFNVETTCEAAMHTATKIRDMLPHNRRQCIDLSVYKTGIRAVRAQKYGKNGYEHRWYTIEGTQKNDSLTIEELKAGIVRIQSLDTPCASVSKNVERTFLAPYMAKIDPAYADAPVIGTKQIGDAVCIRVGSRYCTNISGEHSKNHVYFVVNNRLQMYQKCYSRNNKIEKRRFCYCHEYKSTHVQLPQSLKATLFG